MSSPTSSHGPSVLVSDFDGTMTRHDFYRLAIEELLPPDVPARPGRRVAASA
jgi:hypothetical protein